MQWTTRQVSPPSRSPQWNTLDAALLLLDRAQELELKFAHHPSGRPGHCRAFSCKPFAICACGLKLQLYQSFVNLVTFRILQILISPPSGPSLPCLASETINECTTQRKLNTWLLTGNAAHEGGDDYSSVTYRWDENYVNDRYEILNLRVIHRRMRTGFEECKDIAIRVNDLIAGRYQVQSPPHFSFMYTFSPRSDTGSAQSRPSPTTSFCGYTLGGGGVLFLVLKSDEGKTALR